MTHITTLTMNPALDKGACVSNVSPDRKLRVDVPHFEPELRCQRVKHIKFPYEKMKVDHG